MDFYSPLTPLKYKDFPTIWVKRDDLIDPFISGNKWRKLKYLIDDARRLQKSHLVTFGGAYSNHLLASAAAAARFGFKITGFVRGEQVENDSIFLSRLFGMQHIFVSREDYKNKLALYNKYFQNSEDTYFIDEGGAGTLAVKGCSEILAELPHPFDHIFCAAGTGTTAAGLLNYIHSHAWSSKLHVVPVLKDQGSTRLSISEYVKDTSKLVMEVDYHFGGYAKVTDDLIQFIQDFTSSTGLLLDHVYTAKVFYAIYDKFKRGVLSTESNVLAIHTGGIMGLLGAKSNFPLNLKKQS
ncbi:MAG: pyridoxal-phosphate dependent enzyme [Pedobacter sp.]|nr:MAG: pyridoxal-phosphate dependent enzyme [Pedobacter sp.]